MAETEGTVVLSQIPSLIRRSLAINIRLIVGVKIVLTDMIWRLVGRSGR